MLALILFFTALGSIGSLLGASLLLFFPKHWRGIWLPAMVSVATGSLLGAAFLRVLPEALEGHDHPETILAWTLAGIILFFVLEKMVIWRHCHKTHTCEAHGNPGGSLILIGDGFHNFADGFMIGAAFLQSTELGIAVALAMIAHEVPQEMGDFAILLESGYSKIKAFVYNLLSSVPALGGAVLAYYGLSEYQSLIPYVLALSAASFIYVAAADLVPSLHKKVGLKASLTQVLLIGVGIGLILAVASHGH